MLTFPQNLPNDVEALGALILAERAERRAEHAASSAELAAKQIEIEHLKTMLAKLRRQRYGRSEKLDAEIHQLELRSRRRKPRPKLPQGQTLRPSGLRLPNYRHDHAGTAAFNANANVDALVDALETVGWIVVHVDLG